jgi:hypothetical protein
MTVRLIPYAGKEEESAWRGGPRTPRETLQRNNRITADILGKLMPDVIEPRLKMPAKEALENLASILESWRGHYWRHDHIDQLENKVALAADKLLSDLEELREICGVPRKIETIDQVSKALDRLFNEGIASNIRASSPGIGSLTCCPSILPQRLKRQIQGTKLGLAIRVHRSVSLWLLSHFSRASTRHQGRSPCS